MRMHARCCNYSQHDPKLAGDWGSQGLCRAVRGWAGLPSSVEARQRDERLYASKLELKFLYNSFVFFKPETYSFESFILELHTWLAHIRTW